MLEYQPPPAPPPPVWWSQRGEQLWLRRVAAQGPTTWVHAERPLPRGGSAGLAIRVGADASSLQIMLTAILDVRLSTLRWWLEPHERPELLPDTVFRLGVRYSDGRTVTNLPGEYWTARDEGPVFVTQSQTDPPEELQPVEGAVALLWEVWPAPPSGELTVACAWPYADVPEQRVVFDETEMAAVIERSRRTAVADQPRAAQAAPSPVVWRTPVRWDVTVWLTPGGLLVGTQHDWDAQVASIAEAAHADDWTGDFVDDFLRGYDPARRAAPDSVEFGWFGIVPGAYQLTFPVFARSQDEARKRASSRLEVPDSWSVHLHLETSGN